MNSLKRKSIEQGLKNSSLRVTKPRMAVADTLIQNKDKYLTPEEVFSTIKDNGSAPCDQVSVYRILLKFEELGFVYKNEFKGEASRYRLVNGDSSKSLHQHFFKCISCNLIEPFRGCFVGRKEKELEQDGYRNLIHHLEITGLCPNCG